MDRDVRVYVDLEGTPNLVGRLWSRTRQRQESATFEYDAAWLTHAARFSLEPALSLGPGPLHTAPDAPSSARLAIQLPAAGAAF